MNERAVVIGGGIAGLATAGLLSRQGYSVTLVEKNSELGGRVGVISANGYTWDCGPSWYLMPEAFDRFFELMGTSTAKELHLVDLDPAYRVFPESEEPIDVRSGIGNVERLFESIEPGAGLKIREYLNVATMTYHIALETFLYTTFSSVRPLLTKTVFGNVGLLIALLTTSLATWVERSFHDQRLRHILEYPAVFLSTDPRRAPAMYHLLSHTDLVDGVRYPQGGFGTLIDAVSRLAKDNGVEIRTETEALEITTHAGSVTGVRVQSAGRIEHLPASVVVSGADLHHTENVLLAPELRTYPEKSWRSKDPGISCVVALLGVDGTLPELTHHQLLLSDDWDNDFEAIYSDSDGRKHSRSIYVCKPSETDPSVAPAGKSNLFVLIPVKADENIGHGSAYGEPSAQVEAIVDEVIALVEKRCNIEGFAQRIEERRTLGPADFADRYNAWRGNAIGLAHTLRQSAFLRGTNKSKKVEGLYYAGATTLPGVGLPMCLISAENVLERLPKAARS